MTLLTCQCLTLLLSIARLRYTLLHEFFLLQTPFVRHPSRTRHNGDKGADVQQGPAQRFLFRLSPCVNLFYCLLLFTHPMGTIPTEGTAVMGISPRQTNARTWKYRVHNERCYSAQYMLQSPNTFGSVQRREFGLICINSESCLGSNVGFARFLGLPPYIPFSSAKVALGEPLRLCPG